MAGGRMGARQEKAGGKAGEGGGFDVYLIFVNR